MRYFYLVNAKGKIRIDIYIYIVFIVLLNSSTGLCEERKPINCKDIIDKISKENSPISENRLMVFLRCHFTKKEFDEILTGKQQVSNACEFEEAQERINYWTGIWYERINRLCKNTNPLKYDTSCVRQQLETEQKYDRTGLFGFHIRGPNDIISISEIQDASNKARKAFKNASSAKLALQISVPSGDDANIVKGTLLYPVALMPKPELTTGKTELSAAYLVPSISIDSEKKADDKKGTDSLIFRLGTAIGITNLFCIERNKEGEEKKDCIDNQYFRLNLVYGTDTSFDSRIPGIEFQWEPIHLGGPGTDKTIFAGHSMIYWRFLLQGEYLTPRDTEGTPLENSSDHIYRLGPQLIINFWPFINTIEGLKLYGTASYLLGIEGDPGTTDYFTVGAAYAFDKAGKFSIDGKFETGRLPITYESVNRYSIGLGIKY